MNETRPIISVIFPCYHVLEYLDDLFECIEKQTFQNAEYIFVNDGDDALDDKLDEFRDKDNRIKILKTQNGGAGAARNAGMKIAQGKWIAFCDPDDTFEATYLESLYEGAKEDVDIVIGGYYEENYLINNDKHKISKRDIAIDTQYINSISFDKGYRLMTPYDFQYVVWAKLYRRNFLIDNNLFFNEDLRSGQDTVFNFTLYSIVTNISFIRQCGYQYKRRGLNSLQDLYKPNYINALNLMKEKKIDFMKKRGWCYSLIHKEEIYMEHYVYNMFSLNLFRKNSPYNFFDAKKIIQQEIFKNRVDEKILLHTPSGILEKMFTKSVATRSPFLVALSMKLWQTAVQNRMLRRFLGR